MIIYSYLLNKLCNFTKKLMNISLPGDKQNKFAEKFGFKYNLLADDSKEIIKAFGVWGMKKFRGKEYEGVLRTTFLINEQGVIDRVIDKVKTKEHSDQILE